MVDAPVNVDDLFDADAYWRSGKCPYTIFAYPASLADAQRLPLDEVARHFLAKLQGLEIRVGIWAIPDVANTIYFACPYEDRERIHAAIKELERQSPFGPGFCATRSEYLFSSVTPST